jgi:predicted membrane-bound dolichyl-phosphate-mannose-protein mannosyltransferase
MQPSNQSMDEPYYVPAANSILHGDSLGRAEHPPLGQSIIASGMWIFGDDPLGWRFFSVIFGSISLILFYLICRKLKLSKYNTLLATTLLAVDNLSFVQAGVAMLDVYCLTFMFASVWLYLKKKYILTGFFIGLAIESKFTGIFALLFVILYWLLSNRKNIKNIIIVTVTSAITFLISLSLLDFLILDKLQNPFERIVSILTHTKNLTFANNNIIQSTTIPSRPWTWIFHLTGMSYFTFDKVKLISYILYDMIINPAIWILIIPSTMFLIYLSIKHAKAALFALCWFSATYIIWIPINVITNRLTYDYYFYPAVGAVCIGIALLFSRINEFLIDNQVIKSIQRLITPLYLGISIIFFIFLYNLGSIWFRMSWAAILFMIILYYLERFQSPKITPGNSQYIKPN